MIIRGTKIFGGVVSQIKRNGIVVKVGEKYMHYSKEDVEAAFDSGNYSNDFV